MQRRLLADHTASSKKKRPATGRPLQFSRNLFRMFVSNTSALTGAQAGDYFAEPETASWFFDPLVARSYDVVVIDPPWPFKTRSPNGQRKSASMHYRVMTLAEIMELPVRELLTDSAV